MSLFSALQLKTATAIWQSALKGRSRLAELLVRATPLIVGGQARSWVKAVFVFARVAKQIHRAQGQRGLALFLKASNLLVIRYLAGERLSHSRLAGAAVSVNSQGIPRWIPHELRSRLKRGHLPTIRFVLGLCTLARVLDFRGKLSLKTVVTPGKVLSRELTQEWTHFVRGEFMTWISVFGVKPHRYVFDRPEGSLYGAGLKGPRVYIEQGLKYIWLFTSGPNSKASKQLSVGNAWIDLIALWSNRYIWEVFNGLLGRTGGLPLDEFLPFFKDMERAWANWRDLCKETRSKLGFGPSPKDWSDIRWPGPYGDLGALGIVEEPGKLRIVAMVDCWTQWLLYPLHRFFFDRVLAKLPQDGTFAQAKPIKALLDRNRLKGNGAVWSYDLSAATDRLPVVFQELLLSAFFDDGFAALWRSLLTERDYRVPPIYRKTFGKLGGYVRYAVGQPMGAYSSWAMLAITHHAMVQFAARRAGHRSWFSEYAVLGDDIVIGNRDIAAQYVLLCSEMGLDISFHKSVVSTNNSAEFAKKFYYRGEEASPLSLLGIAIGWLGPSYVPEVISAVERVLGSGKLSLFQIAKYLNIGFKAASGSANKPIWKLPRLLRSTLILLTRPGAPRGQPNLFAWLQQVSAMGSEVARIKSREDLAECLWAHVVDNLLEPRIRKLRTVSREFKPRTQVLGEDFTGNFRMWFDHIPASILRGRVRAVIDESGEVLREARKAMSKLQELKALKLLEDAERILNTFPVELLVYRRPKKREIAPTVARVLAPSSVKRWVKLGAFIERKGARFRKKRGPTQDLVDLGGRLDRV